MRTRFLRIQNLMRGEFWIFSCRPDIHIVLQRIILSKLACGIEGIGLMFE
jgi:hypothetical protein